MTTSHNWQSQDWAQNDVRQIRKVQEKKEFKSMAQQRI